METKIVTVSYLSPTLRVRLKQPFVASVAQQTDGNWIADAFFMPTRAMGRAPGSAIDGLIYAFLNRFVRLTNMRMSLSPDLYSEWQRLGAYFELL